MFLKGFIFFSAVALVAAGVIDNEIGEANSYESTEFVDEDATRTTNNGSRVIFPGTKWCGAGDVASSEEDLGVFSELDKCCRTHDHCEGMLAGETKHGLTNDSPFSK